MKKINNFKVYFSEILNEKYCMNKDGIANYWDYKESQEKFNNRKVIGTFVGLSEIIVATSLSIVDYVTDTNFVMPILILGGIGVLTTKISVSRENPYNLQRYRKIDEEYKIEKVKYKKTGK